jgi:integrase
MTARRLTARFVETVKVDAATGRAAFPDTAVEGLELRVSATGAKSWTMRYVRKSDGARRRVTLGRFPDLGLERARRDVAKLRVAVAEGADPAGGVSARKASMTFAELSGEWLVRHAVVNKGVRSVQDNRSMLKRDILPKIGAMKAMDVTKRDVIRILDAVAIRGDARASMRAPPRPLTHRPNRVFELVRAICRWAVGRDLLVNDPTWGMSAPIKKAKPRERALSPVEIAVLWHALDRTPISRRQVPAGLPRGSTIIGDADVPMTRPIALAMKLALVTGQRIGEVFGTAESELTTGSLAPVWTIPSTRTKNGEPNRVPLSPLALRVIAEARELAAGSPWLFPGPTGASMHAHSATRALERARKAIGIANFRVHDLRRTAATQMAELGVSPHTIGLVLNHVSTRRGTITSGVYIHYSYDREKREALDAWGSKLEKIIAPQSMRGPRTHANLPGQVPVAVGAESDLV